MTYQKLGLASLQELLGGLLAYRGLRPVDARLPALADLRKSCGLGPGVVPRKADHGFACVVAEMLSNARRLDFPGARIRRLVYVGDTRMNDGTAFGNLCLAGRWPGWAFIAQDDPSETAMAKVSNRLYLANRWSALSDFLRFLPSEGFPLDVETALVVDVDKTLIGARGRNDSVIDAARLEAVERTVERLLGARFDAVAFRQTYSELNQPTYHFFTEDNQDYLAYVCLVLGSGLFSAQALAQEARSGKLRFVDWVERVDADRERLATRGLLAVHDEVRDGIRKGDPTPFKAFRHNEYLCTIARFGDLESASVEEILARRICITDEVARAIEVARGAGALVFGLSDKPDEATMPSDAQAWTGLLPLHCLTAVRVGEAQ